MKAPQAIQPRLLNIKSAAQYLGCSVWILRQLEWSGKLPAVRNLGRKLLFDRSDLDRFVDLAKAGAL